MRRHHLSRLGRFRVSETLDGAGLESSKTIATPRTVSQPCEGRRSTECPRAGPNEPVGGDPVIAVAAGSLALSGRQRRVLRPSWLSSGFPRPHEAEAIGTESRVGDEPGHAFEGLSPLGRARICHNHEHIVFFDRNMLFKSGGV